MTPSTAHHPQTDGQTEHVNQEIETYLRVFINHCQDDWADWLPITEFAYNNHIHSSTHCTPFELDTEQHPRMGTEFPCTSTIEAADAFVSHCGREKALCCSRPVFRRFIEFLAHPHTSPTPYHIPF